MSDKPSEPTESDKTFRIRLPGFVTNEEIGLGDVVKRVTTSVGIRPCGGCEGRAAALNRRITFTARKP